MDDLIEWLRAQLDDDERAARAADPGPWEVGPTFGARDSRVYVREQGDPGIDTIGTCIIAGQVANKTRFRENAEHIARWDPARVLAEIDAKRRLLDEHNDPISDGRTLRPGGATTVCGTCHEFGLRSEHQPWPCTTLLLLALPYANRDGYRPEWSLEQRSST